MYHLRVFDRVACFNANYMLTTRVDPAISVLVLPGVNVLFLQVKCQEDITAGASAATICRVLEF